MNIEPDPTESIRRNRLAVINGEVKSEDTKSERQRLQTLHGRVWDSLQLSQDFEVLGFAAPFIVVKRRSGGRKGSLEFQHHPRLYFNFVLDAH